MTQGRGGTSWLLAGLGAAVLAVAGGAGAPAWAIGAGGGVLALLMLVGAWRARAVPGDVDDPNAAAARAAGVERGLRDRAERAEEWLRALDEAVLAIDREGRVAMCNAAAESLLDLRAERLIGRSAEEAFTQADLLAVYEGARAGRGVRKQVRVARPGGARSWEVSAIPLPGGAGEEPAGGGLLLCLRDVTDAALALQVRADFVANASHEVRTPIAAMRAALDTLEVLGEDDGPMRERLGRVIATNVTRLEEMARDLLDLTRLEESEGPGEAAPIPAAALAAELTAAYGPACTARGLVLSIELAPEIDALRSDRRLLILILGNLLDNAAKFAFEGTTVRLTGRATNGGSRGVRFEVIDKGIGIPLDQQGRIFERFYQVDAARTIGSARRGTGLGLAIVKHAVRRLGGTVRVQSVWQQGTTMIVELPGTLDGPVISAAGTPRP